METGFYLTGGTALGRVPLRHRYSEDLALFVNDDHLFQVWAARLLDAWRARWTVEVQPRDVRFVRALVAHAATRLAHIWALCRRGDLALQDALVGASSKAVGVFAADVARALLGATSEDWRLVLWIPPAPVNEFLADLRALGEDLLLVR